jgi:hypothetical protein
LDRDRGQLAGYLGFNRRNIEHQKQRRKASAIGDDRRQLPETLGSENFETTSAGSD